MHNKETANNRFTKPPQIPDRLRRRYPPFPNRRVKPYPFPNPMPMEGRKRVTICIAAICDGGKSIVSVSDERVSTEETSADTLTKCDFILDGNWLTMFAGDVSDATALYRKIDQPSSTKGNDLGAVVGACEAAYWELVSGDAAAKVLAPLNLTLNQFLDSKLPDIVFDRLVTEIQHHQLTRNPSCLLTTGFDAEGHSHLFTINHLSEIHYADRIGFAAIGSGSPSSLSDLYFHKYRAELPYEEALYRVLSAKFMSERASGVGDTTLVMLIRKNVPVIMPENDQTEAIREMWEQEGCARLPEHYRERVKEILRTSSSP